MNNLILQKLDSRYYGNLYFSHRVELNTNRSQYNQRCVLLNEVRTWCWETYGPSCEVDYVEDCYAIPKDPNVKQYPWTPPKVSTKWAWRINDKRMFIYLTDEALTHFQLRWM